MECFERAHCKLELKTHTSVYPPGISNIVMNIINKAKAIKSINTYIFFTCVSL